METNIEIVIKSDSKKVMMQYHGKKTSEEEALYVVQKAYLALVISLLKESMTEEERKECAAEFGTMMAEELLDMMEGRGCAVCTQTFKGKEAAFMAELMKRQGEGLG